MELDTKALHILNFKTVDENGILPVFDDIDKIVSNKHGHFCYDLLSRNEPYRIGSEMINLPLTKKIMMIFRESLKLSAPELMQR